MIIIRPMSWNSGSQLTPLISSAAPSRPMESTICSEVGARGAVGDLHAGRSARRTRRVLQVGDLVVEQAAPARTSTPRESGMASTAMMRGRFSRGISRTNFCTASPHRGGRQHDGGLGIGEDGVEAFGVAGQLGREQRHRDVRRPGWRRRS